MVAKEFLIVVVANAIHGAAHIQEQHIGNNKSCHRFGNDRAAYGYAGVMPPFE
jgi:hypothetical protein